jgi:ABC-type transporter Mla subunit MlaD
MRLSVMKNQLLVGWFALGAIILGAVGLSWRARSTGLIDAHPISFVVDHGQGLQPGGAVLVHGVLVGQVADLALTEERRVRVTCLIAPRYAGHIRTDATATVVVPPLLGASKVEIQPGEAPATVLSGGEIAVGEVRSFLDKFGELEAKMNGVVARVDTFAVQATETLAKVGDVFEQFSSSEGLSAQLLHDPELAKQIRTTLDDVAVVTSRLRTEGLDDAMVALEEARNFLSQLRDEEGEHMALVRDLRAAVKRVDEALERADLPGTTAQVREASEKLGASAEALGSASGQMGDQVDPLSEQLAETLAAFRAASEAFGRLSEELERQPNSVIFGKQPGESPGLRR